MNNLLQKLSNKQRILIVGSQRSGTTIATKILSESLGLSDYYEEQIGSHWRTAKERYPQLPNGHVCQAPHLSAFAHVMNADAVVFMRRDFSEIEASAKRINWLKFEKEEKEAFDFIGFTYSKHDRIWEIKLNWYNKLIKKDPEKYLILDYNDLKSSPLWINKENRTNFEPRQIK